MQFTIREATRADDILVADLSRQTFYDTFAAQNRAADMKLFLDEQFTRGKLMLEVGRPENTFLLAYAEGTVAGYVKLRRGKVPVGLESSSALEIARLYATRDFIGKGVGKLLMQASITMAKDEKLDALWLGVWEHNQRAIEFYGRWGFKKFGEVDFLLGYDRQRDWLMGRLGVGG